MGGGGGGSLVPEEYSFFRGAVSCYILTIKATVCEHDDGNQVRAV